MRANQLIYNSIIPNVHWVCLFCFLDIMNICRSNFKWEKAFLAAEIPTNSYRCVVAYEHALLGVEGKMERQSLNRVSGIWIPHPAQPLLPVVCQILANQRKPETSFNVPNMSNTWKKARFHVLCKCDALFSGYVRYFLQILLQLSFTLEFQYELHLLFQLWKDNARKKVSICSHIARAIYFETHSTQIQCIVNLKQSQEKHFLFYSYSLSNVISSIFSISYF